MTERQENYRGSYYGGDYDDDDFWEWMAVTGAVVGTVAVVDALAEDEETTVIRPGPAQENCQQFIFNGQPKLNCGGVWYQLIMSGSQTTCQQVAPPQQ
jgi:hypothetical protein